MCAVEVLDVPEVMRCVLGTLYAGGWALFRVFEISVMAVCPEERNALYAPRPSRTVLRAWERGGLEVRCRRWDVEV